MCPSDPPDTVCGRPLAQVSADTSTWFHPDCRVKKTAWLVSTKAQLQSVRTWKISDLVAQMYGPDRALEYRLVVTPRVGDSLLQELNQLIKDGVVQTELCQTGCRTLWPDSILARAQLSRQYETASPIATSHCVPASTYQVAAPDRQHPSLGRQDLPYRYTTRAVQHNPVAPRPPYIVQTISPAHAVQDHATQTSQPAGARRAQDAHQQTSPLSSPTHTHPRKSSIAQREGAEGPRSTVLQRLISLQAEKRNAVQTLDTIEKYLNSLYCARDSIYEMRVNSILSIRAYKQKHTQVRVQDELDMQMFEALRTI